MLRLRPAYRFKWQVSNEETLVEDRLQTRTLALAFVLCSRLSTIPDRDDGAASWEDFLETVEEDMIGTCGSREIADR
jgi:hypothetical protein